MDRLQPVPDIRQRARHDYAHRVIEIRAFHLVFDRDGGDVGRGRRCGSDGQRLLGRVMEARGLRKIAAALQNAAAILNIGIGEKITLFRRCEQTVWPQRKSPNPPRSAALGVRISRPESGRSLPSSTGIYRQKPDFRRSWCGVWASKRLF